MAPKNKRQKRNKRQRKVTSVGPVGTVTVPSSAGAAAFPVALRTKLRYFFITSAATGAAGLFGEYSFRSNSLYDPDYTGVGVQPAGFAALATLYSRYRVIGAKVKITAVNDAGGSTTIVFFQRDTTSTYANITLACTQGFSKRAILSDQSGGKNQHTFSVNIKPWEVLGVTKERYMNDDQFAAAVGANPALTSFFGLGYYAVTVACNIQMQVDVMYDAVLYDRVALS